MNRSGRYPPVRAKHHKCETTGCDNIFPCADCRVHKEQPRICAECQAANADRRLIDGRTGPKYYAIKKKKQYRRRTKPEIGAVDQWVVDGRFYVKLDGTIGDGLTQDAAIVSAVRRKLNHS